MIVDNHLDDYKLVELQNFAKNYGLKTLLSIKSLSLLNIFLRASARITMRMLLSRVRA